MNHGVSEEDQIFRFNLITKVKKVNSPAKILSVVLFFLDDKAVICIENRPYQTVTITKHIFS